MAWVTLKQKQYTDKMTTGQLLELINFSDNQLTANGMIHVMKVVIGSEPHISYTQLHTA